LPLAVLACRPSVEVKTIGKPRKALESDCHVKGFITIAPTYPVEPVASAHVMCHGTTSTECRERLKREACLHGGDTIYEIVERGDGFDAMIGAKK